jgi:hypothetical protein
MSIVYNREIAKILGPSVVLFGEKPKSIEKPFFPPSGTALTKEEKKEALSSSVSEELSVIEQIEDEDYISDKEKFRALLEVFSSIIASCIRSSLSSFSLRLPTPLYTVQCQLSKQLEAHQTTYHKPTPPAYPNPLNADADMRKSTLLQTRPDSSSSTRSLSQNSRRKSFNPNIPAQEEIEGGCMCICM